MPLEAEAPASGAMSIDEATAHLENVQDEPQDQAAPAGEGQAAGPGASETPDTPDTPESEGAASAPEDALGEAENPGQDGDETDAQEGAAELLEAPKYWPQDAKADFAELAKLNPALAAVVLAQEGPREAAAAKAKDEAAQARAAAERELQGISRFAEEVSAFLPQAVQTFRSRWGDNPDWVAYDQQHGAQAMSLAKAQYEAERTQLQQVAQASQVAEAKAHEVYVAGEFKALQQIAPDLADPKEGPARRTEIAQYLKDQKIPEPAIRNISAMEMVLARKAMLWDRAQAKSAPNPTPKPAPAPGRPLARGGAATGPADPAAKAAAAAKARFGKSRSIDDAAAYIAELE